MAVTSFNMDNWGSREGQESVSAKLKTRYWESHKGLSCILYRPIWRVTVTSFHAYLVVMAIVYTTFWNMILIEKCWWSWDVLSKINDFFGTFIFFLLLMQKCLSIETFSSLQTLVPKLISFKRDSKIHFTRGQKTRGYVPKKCEPWRWMFQSCFVYFYGVLVAYFLSLHCIAFICYMF